MFATKFQLRVLTGPGAGAITILDQPHYKLGRAHQNVDDESGWIFLQDNTVSRLHAELVWSEEHQSFQLFHRSKTNPSLVNQRTVENALLDINDELRLGMISLRVEPLQTGAAESGPETTTAKFSRPIFCLENRNGEIVLTLEEEEVTWNAADANGLVLRLDPATLGYELMRPLSYPHDVYISRSMSGSIWSTLLRPGEAVGIRDKDRIRTAGQRVVYTKKQATSTVS